MCCDRNVFLVPFPFAVDITDCMALTLSFFDTEQIVYLLLQATGKSCSIDLAMTGEISLTGKVLPVGGIKEKIMAARRAAITKVVLPAANKRDYEEIAEYLKEGLSVSWAEDYSQVYEVAFGNDSNNIADEADVVQVSQ